MVQSLTTEADDTLHDRLTEELVAYNTATSPAIRERFLPDNLASEPVQAYALDEQGALVGGCYGRVERVWHWLVVDLLWVDEQRRGTGLGAALLGSVEDQGRDRGCRWS